MIPKEITDDLRKGMSIEECLCKHNTNFRELFRVDHMNTGMKPKKSKTHVAKYIQERSGHFYLRKSINGKTRMFGTYKSVEDAILVRDELERIGWKQRKVDEICERLGVSRMKGYYNNRVRYS